MTNLLSRLDYNDFYSKSFGYYGQDTGMGGGMGSMSGGMMSNMGGGNIGNYSNMGSMMGGNRQQFGWKEWFVKSINKDYIKIHIMSFLSVCVYKKERKENR